MNPRPFKGTGRRPSCGSDRKEPSFANLLSRLPPCRTFVALLHVCLSPDKGATHTVDETIKFLEKKRDRLQAELTDLVESGVQPTTRLLTTIKGIGITLATALIITTGGFTYFQNAKQVSRYLGICPTYEQSGTSVNIKGHINRNGARIHLEDFSISPLGLPVGSMPNAKETYTRLRQNGKIGKTRYDRCRKQAHQAGFCCCRAR